MMDPDNNPYDVGMAVSTWPNEDVVGAMSIVEQNAWYEMSSWCSSEAYDTGDEL
jgi:hypothetical protein